MCNYKWDLVSIYNLEYILKEMNNIKKFIYKRNRLQQIKGFYYSVRNKSISKAALEF